MIPLYLSGADKQKIKNHAKKNTKYWLMILKKCYLLGFAVPVDHRVKKKKKKERKETDKYFDLARELIALLKKKKKKTVILIAVGISGIDA